MTVTGRPHLVTALTGGTAGSFSYDAAGNTTGRTMGGVSQVLTYDESNRLTRVEVGTSVVAEFSYDVDGSRVSYADQTGTTWYIDDTYEWRVEGSTTTESKNYWFDGTLVAVRQTGALSYLASDGLGSVSGSFEPGPNTTQIRRYLPFGSERTAATLPTSFGFTGQREDDTGLMFYRSRYYDPQVGRFSQPDTIVPDPATSVDLNRYTYVRNNPVNLSDPTGHDPCAGGGGGCGGVRWGDTDGNGIICGGWVSCETPGMPTAPGGDGPGFGGYLADAVTGRDAGDYADVIVFYASEAAVDPFLLWAIVEHESPHNMWTGLYMIEQHAKAAVGNPSIGMAQIQFGTFEATVEANASAFPELGPDLREAWLFSADVYAAGADELSIKVAAYYLSDLAGALEAVPMSGLSENELLAIGYNTGRQNMIVSPTQESLGPPLSYTLDISSRTTWMPSTSIVEATMRSAVRWWLCLLILVASCSAAQDWASADDLTREAEILLGEITFDETLAELDAGPTWKTIAGEPGINIAGHIAVPAGYIAGDPAEFAAVAPEVDGRSLELVAVFEGPAPRLSTTCLILVGQRHDLTETLAEIETACLDQ